MRQLRHEDKSEIGGWVYCPSPDLPFPHGPELLFLIFWLLLLSFFCFEASSSFLSIFCWIFSSSFLWFSADWRVLACHSSESSRSCFLKLSCCSPCCLCILSSLSESSRWCLLTSSLSWLLNLSFVCSNCLWRIASCSSSFFWRFSCRASSFCLLSSSAASVTLSWFIASVWAMLLLCLFLMASLSCWSFSTSCSSSWLMSCGSRADNFWSSFISCWSCSSSFSILSFTSISNRAKQNVSKGEKKKVLKRPRFCCS